MRPHAVHAYEVAVAYASGSNVDEIIHGRYPRRHRGAELMKDEGVVISTTASLALRRIVEVRS